MGHLRMFAPNSSHVQIFSKLSLQLYNDQLMSERQKNLGVTVLVSEIKHIEESEVYITVKSALPLPLNKVFD